jgi:ankyrin repeat protein
MLQDAWGQTALHWAAMRGHERTVALLLLRNADAVLTSFSTAKRPGRSSADLAAENGHAGIAAYVAEVLIMQRLAKLDQRSTSEVMSGSFAHPLPHACGAAQISPHIPAGHPIMSRTVVRLLTFTIFGAGKKLRL